MNSTRRRQTLLCALQFAIFAALLPALSGCSGGDVKIIEPPPTPQTGVSVTVLPDPEGAIAAQQLGWANGIPDAETRVYPEDSSSAPKSFTTSGAGIINLGMIPTGRYVIETRRVLTAAELAKVGAGAGITGFVSRDAVTISSNTQAVVVRGPPSTRRSLVVAEFAWRVGYDGGLPYKDGGYIELYNNADTTVYLDGIAIGYAFDLDIATTTGVSCQQSETMRVDPFGVWALHHQTFPGKGRDYPLRSGQFITVAQDAIDHAPFYAGMPDLRRADFEFSGFADVDNPTVPNMIDKSFEGESHGLVFKSDGGSVFLALPVNLDALPRMNDPRGTGRRWWRYPANSILDVFSVKPGADFGSTKCGALIHPNFDRQHGIFWTVDDKTDFLFSPSRKVLGMTPDGRRILQHSRHSAADFVRGPVTPLRLF